jgi:hypothetical protein
MTSAAARRARSLEPPLQPETSPASDHIHRCRGQRIADTADVMARGLRTIVTRTD